jgi:signal transduction histidine kinase
MHRPQVYRNEVLAMYYDSASRKTLEADMPTDTHPPIIRSLSLHQHQADKQEPKQQAVLLELMRTLYQSLDVDHMVSVVLTRSLEMATAQRACVILLDAYGSSLRWQTSSADVVLSHVQVTAALSKGIQSETIHQRATMAVEDTRQLAEGTLVLLPGRSLMVVPLCIEDKMIGVLTLAHDQPGMFESHHVALFTEVAEIIAQALNHAQSYTRLNEESKAYEEGRFRLVHDIRSPLTAVSASIEIIKRILKMHPIDDAANDLVQDSLRSGLHSLHNVIDLTNNLLDAKKFQIGQQMIEYSSVSIEHLFDEVSMMLQDLSSQERVMLRYQVQPRTLHAPGDAKLLRRMLINLATNAIRFSPQGGTVMLKAYHEPESDSVMIEVEDTGIGIAPEDHERIFQPFAIGNGKDKRGTGLGLAICREIVLAHSGQIWVESDVGNGSRFCVLLPS